MATISIPVALSKHNRAIGKRGKLLWHLPDDLKRFKQLTEGHPVVMGRKTFESIVSYIGGPLPERTNIVVTRNPEFIQHHEGIIIAPTFEDAVTRACLYDEEEVFIGGGSDVYTQALPHTDRLYLTLVDDAPEADTFFPEFEHTFKRILHEEEREHDGLRFVWQTRER